MSKLKRFIQVMAVLGALVVLPILFLLIWWIILGVLATAVISFIACACWQWVVHGDDPLPDYLQKSKDQQEK